MPRRCTRTLSIDRDNPDMGVIAEAAAILRSGGLVAFATETVYGLGADATNPEAVAGIFEAKGRPATNPLIAHVDGPPMAKRCIERWPTRAVVLARRFWPGPLTLVLPRSRSIPDIVTAGRETVGVRCPDTLVARLLIREAGVPIAAPSANRSTGLSPTCAEHVRDHLDGAIDMILDSGSTELGLESTVVDLTVAPLRVLRPGPISVEALAKVMGEEVAIDSEYRDGQAPLASPGQMAVHYAPRTPTYRAEGDQPIRLPREGRWALLSFGPVSGRVPGGAVRHCRLRSPGGAARELYRTLHGLDKERLDFLLISMPPDEPRWRAVRDRLSRAAQTF